MTTNEQIETTYEAINQSIEQLRRIRYEIEKIRVKRGLYAQKP